MLDKWDNLYLEMAEAASKLSHASRKKVGAILVKDNNILSFGYNGTPSGCDNVCEEWMPGVDYGDGTWVTKREVLHAESNAISKVARSTQSSEGSTLYVTLSPCFECAKLIIQSGIKKVVYVDKYRDDSSIRFLTENNIEVIQK